MEFYTEFRKVSTEESSMDSLPRKEEANVYHVFK